MTMAIAELQRQFAKMVTLGVIKDINATKGTAVVDLGDGLETPHIPTVQGLAGANGTTYAMPAVGEQVVVLAMGGRLETAFIMGSVYQDKHPSIATDSKVQMLKAADGAKFIYDGNGTLTISGVEHVSVVASGNCSVTAGGTCVVNAQQATITAPSINLNGDVSISGNANIGGALSVTGTSTFDEKARFNKGTIKPKKEKYDTDKT